MKKIFTLILSLALMQSFGQTPDIAMWVVASAGGSQSTASFSIDWTLGEPIIGDVSGGSIVLTQGFQQGNLLGTDIPIDPENLNISFRMFPNPAKTEVNFVVNNKNANGNFIVDVFDIAGRKIMSQDLGQYIPQETMSLPISTLKSGVYLLKVRIGGFSSDVLKFIKE